MAIRTLVWGENVHDRTNAVVQRLYPGGMHNQIARLLAEDSDIAVTTTTLEEPEHGCTASRLAETDVLVWWGHAAHDQVSDVVVERIVQRVWAGMGLIVLHSAHFSKIFKRLMGSPCSLRWREAGERERLWVTSPAHPIAADLPPYFELEMEEMYGEHFLVPEPQDTVFVSWFAGGEVFRSGLTYQRGAGRIFYFRPGHEAYPTFHQPVIGQVLRNAVHWARVRGQKLSFLAEGPNVPAGAAPEPFTPRGDMVTPAMLEKL